MAANFSVKLNKFTGCRKIVFCGDLNEAIYVMYTNQSIKAAAAGARKQLLLTVETIRKMLVKIQDVLL